MFKKKQCYLPLSHIDYNETGRVHDLYCSHQLAFVLAVLFKKLMCAPSFLYILWFGKQLFMNDFFICCEERQIHMRFAFRYASTLLFYKPAMFPCVFQY